ncbi:MAG TPA: SDR family oxidoreductase [Syntrophorhabdaceae bacterium]|nr:SDR family oxidoreductase [Syntrophorhabdaceae bacterium]
MSLEGKIALVTGASMPHGIGRAAALALARDGADVAVTGFGHMEGAESVAKEIQAMGRRSIAVKMNGRDYKSVQEGFTIIKKELGSVNILVNNMAQMRRMVTIAKTTIEDWDNEVKLCLNSAFYCIKEAWADMCQNKWGRIINMTSVAGVMGGYGQTSYGAAKAGLIGLAKSTALEGARFNITANCVLIGVANTEAYYEPIPAEIRERLENRIAMRRPATPQEIADVIAFIASDKAAYMTGAIVNMMGGLDLFVF